MNLDHQVSRTTSLTTRHNIELVYTTLNPDMTCRDTSPHRWETIHTLMSPADSKDILALVFVLVDLAIGS